MKKGRVKIKFKANLWIAKKRLEEFGGEAYPYNKEFILKQLQENGFNIGVMRQTATNRLKRNEVLICDRYSVNVEYSGDIFENVFTKISAISLIDFNSQIGFGFAAYNLFTGIKIEEIETTFSKS